MSRKKAASMLQHRDGAEEGSFEGDQLAPQNNDTTQAAGGQEDFCLDFEIEAYIVRRQIADFIKPGMHKLPKWMRWRLYERGKKRLTGLLISSRAYEYGIDLLTRYLCL